MQNYTTMSLWALARIIQNDWTDMPHVVRPYLNAILTTEEHKCFEGITTPVGYFLCNAHGWKGDVAHAVKAELNRRLHP